MNLSSLTKLLAQLIPGLKWLSDHPEVLVPPTVVKAPLSEVIPKIEPQPIKTVPIEAFCMAIRDYEGAPGDKNYRNNNPGNFRCSRVGYDPKYGVVKCDKDNFAIFSSYQMGWLYLTNIVRIRAQIHPTWTIYDFFSNYAPTNDRNNPKLYAQFVARRLKVDPGIFRISNLAG